MYQIVATAPNEPEMLTTSAADTLRPPYDSPYRAFFDHAEDSLCELELTEDGRFLLLQINPHAEKVMGFASAAVRGLSPEQILGPEAGGRTTAALRRAVAEGGLRYEETWTTLRGNRITDTIFVPLRDGGGRVSRVLCSMRDITERRELERQLAQAHKLQALGQLAGGVAHDFNNVLQAVEGSAALLSGQAGDPEAVRRLGRIIGDAAARGAAITRRLLTLARRSELRAEPLDLAALLGGLREVLGATLGPSIEIRLDVATGLPPVLADKGQLETVLVNLATNARDAMPKGGMLAISAMAEQVVAEAHPAGLRPGGYIRLQVADTGCGMDPETASRALEPFFTTKPIDKGTGLGLPMARGFAEESGGALSIASAPGVGTTVALWLPPAAAVEAVAPPEAAPPEAPAPLPRRVLLVDDDSQVREMVTAALEFLGHEVIAATGAEEALARLDDGCAPDLMLTDLCMPGLDGLGLIAAARQRRPDLPIILATGSAEDSARLLAGGPGSWRILRKPFSLAALCEQLNAAMAEPT